MIHALRCVTLALALAACGGDDAASYDTAQELADALNANGVSCANLDLDASPELYVREQGSCLSGGSERLVIRTFVDDGARQRWVDAAKQFGGIHVVGDRWVVAPERQDTAERVRAALGGAIR